MKGRLTISLLSLKAMAEEIHQEKLSSTGRMENYETAINASKCHLPLHYLNLNAMETILHLCWQRECQHHGENVLSTVLHVHNILLSRYRHVPTLLESEKCITL